MSARVARQAGVCLFVLAVMATGLWAQPQTPLVAPPLIPPPPPPQLAATVNGRDITEDEATRLAWTQMGRAILERAIDGVLVRQAASRAGLSATEAEVSARLTALASKAGGTGKLVAARGVAGVEALRSQLAHEILLEKLVDAAGKVSDEKARQYYDEHRADYTTPTRVHLFEIVAAEAETAYQSRRRIADGEAFGVVAREVSSAPSREQGGDLGWVVLDEIAAPALRSIVATLTVGEVSTPVLVDGAFHILMVTEKQPGEVKSYEAVKEEIVGKLREESGASAESVLVSLRRAAKIEVHAEPYKYLEEEYARLSQIKVVANGKTLDLPKAPVILPSGRMIVPAKEVFRGLGCRITWVSSTKTLVIATKEKSVRVAIGSDTAQVDGQSVALGEKTQLREGIVWVAPRPVAEALGFKVGWDPTSYELTIAVPAE